MSFDSSKFVPRPNNWFSTYLTYSGWGHAEFFNPSGWVEGNVEIQVDETGEVQIDMTIEKFSVDPPIGTGSEWKDMIWLLEGTKPLSDSPWEMFAVGNEPLNKCLKLTVRTIEGIFETIEAPRYYRNLLDDSHHISFFCVYSAFEVSETSVDSYLVLPLTNFISEIAIRYPALGKHPLDQHPLRIFPTPVVPDELQDVEQRGYAFAIANGANAIIPFKFNNAFGFIERLSDYEEREEQLAKGEAKLLITALLVVTPANQTGTVEELLHSIPLDFLHLLSLATGSLIGVPWIEFRDSNKRLIRRIHTRQWTAPYFRGHIALDLFAHGGIGHLLSRAPSSLDSALRIAMLLTVKGGNKTAGLDDQLAYLFRALDTLCEEYISKETTKPSDFLTQSQQQKLSLGLKAISKVIDEITEEIKQEQDDNVVEEKTKLLNQIRSQILSAKNITVGFGQAVSRLIQTVGLQDVEIVEGYYSNTPRDDKRKWRDVLSMYRGIVIHRNYFMTSNGIDGIEDSVRIRRHIHDLLLRIILKKLNYDGTYMRVIGFQERVGLDWVKSETDPRQLGYGTRLR